MFYCRNMSLIGGVVLLLAESRVEARSRYAGLPSTGENKLKEYLQVRLSLLSMCGFETIMYIVISILV